MRRSGFIFLFSLPFLMIACGNRTNDPVNTSCSFPESQVSLGGVVAEQLTGLNQVDSSQFSRPSILAEDITRLQKQAEELKKNNESVTLEAFDHAWQEVRKGITFSFEELSDEDIKNWVTLNDSLLKYSGKQRFAEELEKMVYNTPVPEVITEQMIKSFCYTRLYDRIYVNLFGSSAVEYEHTTGGKVRIMQDTKYPFENRVILNVELQDTRYLDLFIRIPEWSKQNSVTVKGVMYNTIAGDYTEIARKWKNGDKVEIILGFKPTILRKNSSAIAFTYGPLILGYSQKAGKEIIFQNGDPIQYLKFVSFLGEIPTFTFSGIPNETLVLQPFFTEQQTSGKRTAWIRTTP